MPDDCAPAFGTAEPTRETTELRGSSRVTSSAKFANELANESRHFSASGRLARSVERGLPASTSWSMSDRNGRVSGCSQRTLTIPVRDGPNGRVEAKPGFVGSHPGWSWIPPVIWSATHAVPPSGCFTPKWSIGTRQESARRRYPTQLHPIRREEVSTLAVGLGAVFQCRRIVADARLSNSTSTSRKRVRHPSCD